MLKSIHEEHSRALVGLLFDFLLSRPLSQLLPPEELLTDLEQALEPEALQGLLKERLPGILERSADRLEARGECIKDGLPPEWVQEAQAWAWAPVKINQIWINEIIQQEATRHLLQSIIEESLERFLQLFKSGTPLGRVGRFASGFRAKGLFGGLSDQIEAQLGRSVKSFIEGSLSLLLERLAKIISSQESAQLLGRSRGAAVEALLEMEWSELLRAQHLEELVLSWPDLLIHNLQREEVVADLREELKLWIQEEGQKSLGECLGEEKRSALRRRATEFLAPLALEFWSSPEFQRWLSSLSSEQPAEDLKIIEAPESPVSSQSVPPVSLSADPGLKS